MTKELANDRAEAAFRERFFGAIYLQETSPTYPLGLEYFQPEVYSRNVQYLGQLRRELGGDPRYVDMPDWWFPILDIPIAQAITQAKAIRTAPDIYRALSTLHAEEQRAPIGCAITHTHSKEPDIIQTMASNASIPMKNIALVVIDTHLDLDEYSTNPQVKKSEKNSVYRQQLDQGIGGVAILGVSPGYVSVLDDIRQGAIRLPADDPHRDIAMIIARNRQRLIVDPGIRDKTGRVDRDKLTKTITSALKVFQNNRVTHIVPIVDLDGYDLLHEGMTATSYNPFAAVSSLGMQEFPIAAANGLPLERRHQALLRAYHDITYPHPRTHTGFHQYPVHTISRGGFRRPDMERAFSHLAQTAKGLGFTMGLLQKSGQWFAGHITEAVGQDLDGKTTDAIRFTSGLMRQAVQR